MAKKFPFTKKMRVTRNREFQAIYEEGFRQRGAHLTLISKKNGTETTRLGLSVAKKRMNRAVDRNRFKRWVREAFRLNREQLPQGCDLLVIPNHGIDGYDFENVSKEFLTLSDKVRRKFEKPSGAGS